MTTTLDFNRDVGGAVAYAPQFSGDRYSATLTVGLEATLTVPGNAAKKWIVSFGYQPGVTVWVAVNATAAVPVGATLAATTSELNPGQKYVKAGDVLHLISGNMTADVGVAFYAI